MSVLRHRPGSRSAWCHAAQARRRWWASLMRVPSAILHAATGISEETFDEYKKLPLVIAPGTGGNDCLAKCGLNFTTVRS